MKKRSKVPLIAISEEMKAWSAALESEVRRWPVVRTQPMFGLTALYRGKKIFAILPRTRGMGSPNSLAFKFEQSTPAILARLQKEPRISTTIMRARRWFVFELQSARDLRAALSWLEAAYQAAVGHARRKA